MVCTLEDELVVFRLWMVFLCFGRLLYGFFGVMDSVVPFPVECLPLL